MPYFILALAAATILLIGCQGTLEERQERAQNVLDGTKTSIFETVKGTRQTTETVTSGLTETATKIHGTATEVQKQANAFTKGVQKIKALVKRAQKGIYEIRGTIQPAGGLEGAVGMPPLHEKK